MPKVILSTDGVVIKEVQLTKERSTLGRRPYNDIVIDNLAVSGEHAALQMVAGQVFIEDLNSTNGTYLNGKPVKKHPLHHGDILDVGKYQIQFIQEPATGAAGPQTRPAASGAPASPPAAALLVMSGRLAGRTVPLDKPETTLGKPGAGSAAIHRHSAGYTIALVEGLVTVNGNPLGAHNLVLRHGDLIELAGIQVQYVLQ